MTRLKLFALSLLVVLLSVAVDPRAAEAQFVKEIRAGVLGHDVDNLWSGFKLETSAVDVNAEILFAPGLPFMFGSIRPALGGSFNTAGGTSHVYLDARWEIETPVGLFFGLGLGLAVHDGEIDTRNPDLKALGSRALFHIPLEIGVRLNAHSSLSVYFEHTSNANFADINEGLDRLGVRYGYRF